MTPREEALHSLFAGRSIRDGGLVLYDRSTALEFVEACRRAGMAVAGIEGFELVGEQRVMPRMDLILDLSSMWQSHESNLVDATAEEARRFLLAMPGDSVVIARSGDVVVWDFAVGEVEMMDQCFSEEEVQMARTWQVGIDGTTHKIEADYKPLLNTGRGSISVDGRVVDAWGSALLGLPRERRFEVAGRPAILRKSGLIFENYELFVDGFLVPHQR